MKTPSPRPVTSALASLLLLAAMLLWSGLLHAVPQIQHWQTANGARVYFVAAHELPMVDVRVVFDAGSARDGTKPGVALLTAGLLAEGAGTLDADTIAARFDALGARFGSSAERDSATLSLRSLRDPALLEPALDTLALLLRTPTFPEGAFERERRRALIALRAQEQNPAEVADRAFYAALYGDHPYAGESLGTETSLRQMTREDLREHYARHYVGRNTVVAIVGDLTRAAAEQVAEQVVGALPAGSAAAPLPAVTPPAAGRDIHLPHPSSQTHILVGQPVLRRGDPDYFTLYVGNHILGGSGLVSRISDEVREKRGLAYSAYSYFMPMREAGPFQLGLQTKNASAAEALAVLRATLQRYLDEGPTAAELTAAKKNITGGFPLRIDSNSDIVGYLAMIGFYGLPLDYLEHFNARVEAVTLEQIREAFRRRVDPARLITLTVGNGSP